MNETKIAPASSATCGRSPALPGSAGVGSGVKCGAGRRDAQATARAPRSSAGVCLIVTRIAGMLSRHLPPRSDFAVTFRSVMDEARIQEIVDRVIARIGDLPETPAGGGEQPAAGLRRSRPRRAARRPPAGARSTSRAGAGACSPTSTRR